MALFDAAIFDSNIFDTGAEVVAAPGVDLSWEQWRFKRDHEAKLRALADTPTGNDLVPVAVTFEDATGRTLADQQADARERIAEAGRLSRIELDRIKRGIEQAEIERQIAALAEMVRQEQAAEQMRQQMQMQLDDEAAKAFMCWLMND